MTPNIDRFASEGVIFRNAFCPAPHCCPSRASFQTGLYPSEHGVFNNVETDTAIHANPYPGRKYFASVLYQNGYELDYSGKWHVGRDFTPWDAGWRNSYTKTPAKNHVIIPGLTRRDSAWKTAKSELQSAAPRQPGEVIRPGWGNQQMYKTVASEAPDGFGSFPADYEPVFDGIDKMSKLKATKKPWALMISNNGAHDLYHAPKNFVDLYDPNSVQLPESFRDTLEDKPRIYQRMRYQYWDQMSKGEVRETVRHYWAKISMQDALFGRLLDALEKTGQADKTIVLYVADHGDYAGAHGLWAKGVPSFREAYNIPCIFRWGRGAVRPGRIEDALVSTTDFAPTFLEAAGIPSTEYHMSGKSLLPWLKGETPTNWREALFTQMNGVELYYSQRIIMTKDYKYVYNGFDYDELYDLKNDPHEMVNLAFPDAKRSRDVVESGKGLEITSATPWPHLEPGLAEVRRSLLTQMWEFAQQHKDQIFNPYITVAMSPYGPGLAL